MQASPAACGPHLMDPGQNSHRPAVGASQRPHALSRPVRPRRAGVAWPTHPGVQPQVDYEAGSRSRRHRWATRGCSSLSILTLRVMPGRRRGTPSPMPPPRRPNHRRGPPTSPRASGCRGPPGGRLPVVMATLRQPTRRHGHAARRVTRPPPPVTRRRRGTPGPTPPRRRPNHCLRQSQPPRTQSAAPEWTGSQGSASQGASLALPLPTAVA